MLFPVFSKGQPVDSLTGQKTDMRSLRTFAISSSVVYGASLVGLSQLWYRDSERQSFRFFNDNAEWKQVDKLGHFFSTFYLSYGTSQVLQSFHVKPRKADLIGAITGFGLLLPIELFDGYSNAYGASAGDLIANAAGPGFYLLQTHLWSEVRLYPKFSFHQTRYAGLRPEVLGKGLTEEILKDYNGQTYWLSVDLDKFTRFPKWLNLAVGYGAEGMVYARDRQNRITGLGEPYRQYYLSIDLDVTAINTRSKVLKTVLFFVNMVKIPAPTLQVTKNGLTFNPFYF